MNNLLNFKSYVKFLSRNKAFSVINVFGLSVSLMFVILIMVYVGQGLSTDRFHENGDRIFVIGSEQGIGFAWRIGERVAERYPEIEKICPMRNYPDRAVFVGDEKYKANVLFTDTTFFSMFTFPLSQGDPKTVMSAKNYAVISETFARQTFGNSDPLGKIIKVSDSIHVIVNGVIKDMKNSTIPYSDILVRIDNIRFFNPNLDTEMGDAVGLQVFFQTVKGADLQSKSADIEAFLKDVSWIYQRDVFKEVIFTSLKDVYFSEQTVFTTLLQSSWSFVVVLMFIGILILIFATINYINLTVAQAGSRAKEMATRRLLGSSRGDLFIRLILESTAMCFISFLVGLFLAYAVLPYANDLLQTKIDLIGFFTIGNSLIVLFIIMTVGFISGLLPAIIISNTSPIDVVKGSFRTKTKMVFSKIFITFQNVITIMLIAASITMILQINHMIKAPLGYNTENILNVPTFQFENREKINAFINETRQLASVKRVATSWGTPFDRGSNNTMIYNGKNISAQSFSCDSVYFNMLGFEVIHRNNSNNSGNQIYINEQMLIETELPVDVTEITFDSESVIQIDGVVRDFQLSNILHKKQPVFVNINPDFPPRNVSIETQGDPFVARNQIKEVYERISQLEFSGEYMEEQIKESYAEQSRLAKLVVVFTFIAIIISFLGLLAMSTYFIQQRSREVSVRKVFGSSSREVLVKLVTTFLNYVLIAFVIATPVIWYIMKEWLLDYSYRISLYPWIFAAAGLFCFLIAFVTVFFQSWYAANANPAKNIKIE